ncbi:MAG: hypothetical protein IE927_01675 [Rhodobacterales bacterium]|nr:hypothetical protein [Rhodobacterales bacterium]
MSTVALTSGVAVVLSTLFLAAAVVIPLGTVLGILLLRQTHGLHSHFGVHEAAGDGLWLTSALLSIQVVFGLSGLAALRAQGYARRYLTGSQVSAGSHALVCPGVAASMMLQFWINKGLVGAGLIAKFGLAYWALSGVAVALQLAMVVLVLVLNRRHFRAAPQPVAVPAE